MTSWNFHKGGKPEDLKTEISKAKELPQAAKDFLISQIGDPPPGALGLKLDAYCQDVDKGMQFQRNIAITLSWVKV